MIIVHQSGLDGFEMHLTLQVQCVHDYDTSEGLVSTCDSRFDRFNVKVSKLVMLQRRAKAPKRTASPIGGTAPAEAPLVDEAEAAECDAERVEV